MNATTISLNPVDWLGFTSSVVGTFVRRLPAHVSREDLEGVARVALVSTLSGLDDSMPIDDVKKIVAVRIKGAVLDELRRLDPLSRRMRARVRLLQATANTLTQSLGREPTFAELAAAAELPKEAVQQALDLAQAAGNVGDCYEIEVIDDDAPAPNRVLDRADTSSLVYEAISKLPQRQAEVIVRYYMEDQEPAMIAQELGISVARVSQLRLTAEKNLRNDSGLIGLH